MFSSHKICHDVPISLAGRPTAMLRSVRPFRVKCVTRLSRNVQPIRMTIHQAGGHHRFRTGREPPFAFGHRPGGVWNDPTGKPSTERQRPVRNRSRHPGVRHRFLHPRSIASVLYGCGSATMLVSARAGRQQSTVSPCAPGGPPCQRRAETSWPRWIRSRTWGGTLNHDAPR